MSSESSTCRIDWRPSRLLCSALASLGTLGATAIWLSALPVVFKAPFAVLALGYGLWIARREARRQVTCLHWTGQEAELDMTFPGQSVRLSKVQVLLRGPLACVSGHLADDRIKRFVWCPDTLPASSRRALRLASDMRIEESGPSLATMTG